MKTKYRLHVKGSIELIKGYELERISDNLATVDLTVCTSGNADKDEVATFLLDIDDIDITAYFGFPEKDNSNAIIDTNVSVWNLMGSCEIN